MIDPITVIARSNKDSTGLGFKKVPFHLGINKFVSELECSIEHEAQIDSDIPKDSDDGKDLYPYPIPYNLAKFFGEPDGTSDSSGDIVDAFNINYLSKNLEDEGEWVPITLSKFYNMSPHSTDSREYEFDSLSKATSEKDIDQIHVYENQLKWGKC